MTKNIKQKDFRYLDWNIILLITFKSLSLNCLLGKSLYTMKHLQI